MVRFLELLIERKGTADIYNCGTGTSTSILQLAEFVRNRFGPQVALTHGPPRVGDIRHSTANISKARSIGYEPRVAIADWIRTTTLA